MGRFHTKFSVNEPTRAGEVVSPRTEDTKIDEKVDDANTPHTHVPAGGQQAGRPETVVTRRRSRNSRSRGKATRGKKGSFRSSIDWL